MHSRKPTVLAALTLSMIVSSGSGALATEAKETSTAAMPAATPATDLAKLEAEVGLSAEQKTEVNTLLGFPNRVGNSGRDRGSIITTVDGRTGGDCVILESSNADSTFKYGNSADRVAIKVEYVAGGAADAADHFLTLDGVKCPPCREFAGFSPEWFERQAKHVLFLA